MAIDEDPTAGKDIDFQAPDKERESAPIPREIWMIEDNAAIAAALMRMASMRLSQNSPGAQMVHFQEGEVAIAKFRELAENNQPLPVLVLMDYKLDEEVSDPKYKTGVEVIEEMKAIAAEFDLSLPEIVAFSSEESYSFELINAGASSAVNKQKDAFEYFKNLRV